MFQQYWNAKNNFLFILVAFSLLASCTVVKNAPENKPFVYKNKITVTGKVSKDEVKRLQAELVTYWDDSVLAKPITQFGVKTVIKNPKIFDSANVTRSIVFMNSYLNAQGYYNAHFKDSIHIDTVGEQLRTTVGMYINVNKNLTIDSVALSFDDSALQQIAMNALDESFLAKKKPFKNQLIASELDRLTTLFRKNGYFKLSRDNLFAEVDTSDIFLLEITLDPFEQARRIAEAAQKRLDNPTINVVIRQRASTDSNAFKKYYTNKIFYYPETLISEVPDSLMNRAFQNVITRREFTVKHKEVPIVNLRPLREHTYLKEGTLYNDQNYFKTVNALSQLGAWNQVEVRTVTRRDSVDKIDFHFFLTPAKKYSFGTDLEVSRNSGSIVSGNLLGIANVLTLRNRNVWKGSIQSSTNLRNGIELGFTDTGVLLQTFQSSISQTYSIPRLITPFKITGKKQLDDYKTIVNLNASYTERRKFYRLRSLVGSWGYEWKKNKHVWLVKPLSVELFSLDTLLGLKEAFNKNPFLRTAFNTGYVVSNLAFTYNINWTSERNPNISNYFRVSGEESGAIMGRFAGLNNKIYQYVKAESEVRQRVQYRKTELAYRLFAGVGYNYSKDPIIGQSLPFFKQFVGGGPNSMRAWPVRQLGLGSSLLSDTSDIFRDRYGDIQLEANVEYRFPLIAFSAVKVNSAFFVDVGNLWNMKYNAVDRGLGQLKFNRFLTDMAIAAGTGLRFDFNYFLVRIDFGYKVKDPTRLSHNGWMSIKDFEWTNKEIDVAGVRRKNWALQLGIGLPF